MKLLVKFQKVTKKNATHVEHNRRGHEGIGEIKEELGLRSWENDYLGLSKEKHNRS